MQLSLGLARSPLESVRDALLCEFGPQRPVTRMDPISQLVKSSISGRTQDTVSWAAFLRLRAEFKCWEDLAQAPVAAVTRIIDDVTFPADKARHLTTALKMIDAKVGWLSLNHLKGLEVDQARWELQALPGVGVKVAACVLNFSDLAMRSLVVDTHVHRVAKRIGLVGAGDTTHAYHTLMSLAPNAWTADDFFELHWLLKRGLGQMLCPHEGPKCGACPVKSMCAKAGVGRSADVLAWKPRG
jgi:endonuclease-3